jgi:histidyl-tRNA synthetase
MKPSIPKGTRDFSPQEMVKRNYIFDTIRKVYQSYGYQPIETPAFENSETLMGKYGEEGDRLIFKILNSGNYLDGLPVGAIHESPLPNLTKHISEKALRYDLTVPFARYVVQHRNDITFPFKRYQIQPVWRADRPQKGRYREFYQCDADVIGSDSLLNEVELIQIIDEVFTKLGVPVIIKINNRKILQGIAEYIGAPDKMIVISTVIDKIDKIRIEDIYAELEDKGLTSEQSGKLITILQINETNPNLTKEGIGNSIARLNGLKENFNQPNINKGIEELIDIIRYCSSLISHNLSLEFDPSLARGLNYYTGTIIEVKVDASKCASQFTSSICGGGRYDDLTGIFGLPDVSGVGISFGADRIYDVIEELKLFPNEIAATTKVLLINFGDKEAQYCLKVLKDLHTAGISAELYPDAKKINKQFEYADKRNIPYVISIGEKEMESGRAALKNMITKEQIEVPLSDLTKHIK